MKLSNLHASVASVLLFVPSMAAAQTAGATPAADEAVGKSSSGGEIVVTARRKEESLQKVPIAISAFDGAALEKQQISGLLDVGPAVPSLIITPNQGSANGATIFIRGQGQDGSSGVTETGVGIYLDGVYLARSIGSLVDMNNFERIEVLRGPQGTLYGRNTPGGAVKLVTKRPKMDAFSFDGDLTLGSFNRLDLRGTVNVPLADNAAISISGLNLTNDGYYRHALTNQRLHKKDTTSVRAGLLWEPTDNLTIYATADYTKDRSGLNQGTPFDITDPANFVPLYGSIYRAAPDSLDINKYDGGGVSVIADLNLPNGTLTSITAYRRLTFRQAIDFGASPLGLDFSRDMMNNQFSQEVQYASDLDGAVNFVGGLYYYREYTDETLRLLIPTNSPTINNLPGTVEKSVLEYPYKQTTNSYSIFGEVYVTPIDPLTITLGGRYTHEPKTIERTGGIPGFAKGTNSFSKFLPKVTADLKFDSSTHAYVTWSKGMKAGAYQGYPSPALALVITPPEVVTAWEVGLKSEPFDNVLWLNLAAYENRYDDLIINFSSGSGQVILNSADLVVRGIEAEMILKPATGFTVNSSFAVSDSEFKRVPNVAGAPLITDRGKNLPSYQLRVSPSYEHAFGNGDTLTVGATFTATGKDQKLLPNDPFHLQKAYETVDARIAYTNQANGWSVELAGRNLTNEHYFLNSTLQAGRISAVRWYQPGRTWMLRLGVKY